MRRLRLALAFSNMNNDGKALENLVRQIEKLLLPEGFSVKGNIRVHNDEGVQIAEFDVEIRGRLGSTDIAWLIECRDRPGKGPAPGSWIEQLVGRRDRFGFNKVTAVSTTGFADEAAKYAKAAGMELRTVKQITAQDVAGWLGISHLHRVDRITRLDAVRLLVAQTESPERVEALAKRLNHVTGNDKLLRSIETGETISAAVAFQAAVAARPDLFSDIQLNGPGKSVRLRASYPNEASHFVVDTDCGAVWITEILFQGELCIKHTEVPVNSMKEYRREGTCERIAQTAAFPIEIQGMPFSLEMHHLADTGETHVVLRKL
jgi:hypothetical protein